MPEAVRPHDGMDLTRFDNEVDPAEDLVAFHFGMKIFDFQHSSKSFGGVASVRFAFPIITFVQDPGPYAQSLRS